MCIRDRCAKFSPIIGKNDDEMRIGVENFIYNVLQVDVQEFSMDSVVAIRRVKSFGTANTPNECLVIFADVERRDYVYSHARNLANQPLIGGKREANLRMQIPAHLLECFRTLDKHGHLLKQKYDKRGSKLRRHCLLYTSDAADE